MADTDPYFSVPEKRSKGVSDEKTGMPGAAKPQQDATTSSGPVGAGMNKKAVASSGATTGATISSTPSRQTQGPASASKGAESKAFSLEEANEEIALLLQSGKVTQKEVSALQGLMRDHVALGEKVPKLKSLLGRSAKAQREAKMELESTSKKLEAALREIDRLSSKVERLANRPTHMDLLADFETNFDKALLSGVDRTRLLVPRLPTRRHLLYSTAFSRSRTKRWSTPCCCKSWPNHRTVWRNSSL